MYRENEIKAKYLIANICAEIRPDVNDLGKF
jgi:hypothetical protein